MLDDIIVWWVGEERFDVMPNASNTERVISVLGGEDVTSQRAVIAVQGPRARERLAAVSPDAAAVGHFAVADFEFKGVPVPRRRHRLHRRGRRRVRRSRRDRPRLLAGRDRRGCQPAGLGARDTLRLESGLPLHGHELGAGHHLAAGRSRLGRRWDKGPFRGREPLESASATAGPWRRLRGLLTEGRRPPRNEDAVLVGGEAKGVVTSGNYSPVLQRGIALAFLPPETAIGAEVEIELRGGRVPAVVVKPPFQKLTVATTGGHGGPVRAAGSSS